MRLHRKFVRRFVQKNTTRICSINEVSARLTGLLQRVTVNEVSVLSVLFPPLSSLLLCIVGLEPLSHARKKPLGVFSKAILGCALQTFKR